MTAQYRDQSVNAKKRCKPYPKVCELCSKPYEARAWIQRWCDICVPNKKSRERMRRYGISETTYQQMLKDQNGLCAICETEPPSYVDHNHSTGKVRKLLCSGCNTRLAAVDDTTWLEKALKYVSIF
jgi:hypothetical protein